MRQAFGKPRNDLTVVQQAFGKTQNDLTVVQQAFGKPRNDLTELQQAFLLFFLLMLASLGKFEIHESSIHFSQPLYWNVHGLFFRFTLFLLYLQDFSSVICTVIDF
jgi:hypothetical protein